MTYLKINNIKKSFKKVEVLKGIDIDINKGELICFLGPSGCGKTTLLRIIAGLEKQNSGEIILEGKDISNLSPAKRKIGIVFQNYALFPNLNVYENIAYGLKNRKLPKEEIDRKVNDMLNIVGLQESKNKYPSEISGGQQQRVALVRSLVLEPEILLLDEPLSALDAKVRESLREEIKSLQRKLNITTILVTHDQEEALTMGDKIVVFNQGNIMQIGNPEEIYYKPSNEFTADFVGKINFVENLNGENIFVRPECMNFSLVEKDGYNKGKIANVEFRGNIYRVKVEFDNNPDNAIYLDLSWKERETMEIEVGREICVDLSSEVLKYEE